MDLMASYSGSMFGLGVFGILYLVQLLIADVAGLRAKHTPGSAVTGGHSDFLFRSHRAHANTTESIGAFILLALFAILTGGDPLWTALTIWSYVGLRALHTVFYYLNFQTMRSVVFGLGLLALLTLFGIGIVAS
ncbi:MAG: MAPEG family protein [Gammaproteobacteria bacterium]|nr:MAPEG family protein [Gammaproteobacteria bacterium]